MAISVAVGYFRMVRKRSPPCFPLLPGWAGGSWRTFIRLGLSPPLRNVPDECLLSFQRSLGHFSPHSFTATSKAKKRHLFFQSFKIFCFSHSSKKSESPPNIVEGLWNRDAEKQKKGPTASFGSESLAELCELLCCYAGLHIFGRSNGD